jgi:cell division protein FtsL
MMAAPQRRYRAALPTEPAWPVRKRGPKRSPEYALRRKAAGRRRRFAMFVVVPVLLMLGSVYLHMVAAGLGGRAAELHSQLGRAWDEGERLQVKVTELSGSARIRELAGKLGMRQPDSDALKVYGNGSRGKAEDGTRDGKQQKGGEQR